MYGTIGKFVTHDNQRDQLIDILLEGMKDMPGCISYVVARDTSDANGIWVTRSLGIAGKACRFSFFAVGSAGND